MIESIIAWLTNSLILLFLWVFAGSLGAPGGTITMIVFGSLAKDLPSLIFVIIISFIASVLGDIVAYTLARRLSNQVNKIIRKFSFFGKNELKANSLLKKYGFFIVFFTRFALISLCSVVSYISGLQKLNRKKFIMAVLSGEFLFALIYPTIGYTVGEIFGNLLNAINDFVVAVLILALVVYLFMKFVVPKMRKRK